jgi:hypothetical protein
VMRGFLLIRICGYLLMAKVCAVSRNLRGPNSLA